MNFHDIGGSCVYTILMMRWRLAWDALRCHVVFSDRRFDHFSPHYYYLKGLLFCFWLILQPPGDRNHDVGLGQAWLVACLMAEELLHFTCAAQPNFLYYSSVIAFSIRQQISFKNDPMLVVLLLDSSRKINHLCNIFNDLLGQFPLN